jgi:hypothetical protein
MDVYQRRRLVALGVVVVVIGLIVAIASAGDGGSDETAVTTTSTADNSKSSFIASADGICAETATAVANLSSDDVAQQAKQELDFTKSELSQIKALQQPTEDKAKLDAFYTAVKDQIESLSKKADAAQAGDTTEVASIDTQLASAEANVRAAAQSYGLKQCGEEGEPSSSGGGGGGGTSGGTTSVAPATTTPVAPATTTTPVAPAPTEPTTPPSGGTGGDTGGGSGGSGGSGGIGSG